MSSTKLMKVVDGLLAKRPGKRSNRPSRSRARQGTAALPAAYASHVRPRFNMRALDASTVRVSGCDLVYPIPRDIDEDFATIFAMFPANPAYWIGTRISQIAAAYQTYRPMSFKVSYIPQVAVTTPGTVFMGTLWNQAAPINNIQQTLFTSNGGCLTQCYVPCDTTVKCGKNLQQNLFQMTGALSPDTCPFLFAAGVRGANVVPGYFYVEYTYELRNPIGSSWVFNVVADTTAGMLTELPYYSNMTIVLLDEAGGFGPGTQLDLEVDGTVFYHGSKINLDPSVKLQLYSNMQAIITPNNFAEYYNITTVQLIANDGETVSKQAATSEFEVVPPDAEDLGYPVSVQPGFTLVEYDPVTKEVVSIQNDAPNASAYTRRVKKGRRYKILNAIGKAVRWVAAFGKVFFSQLNAQPALTAVQSDILPSNYTIKEL